MVTRQRPDGGWDYPHPGWKGRVATAEGCWAAIGLLDAHRRSQDPTLLAASLRWQRFLDEHVGWQRSGGGLAVNYFGDRSDPPVPNNSVFTLRFLATLARGTGDDSWLRRAPEILTFLASAQLPSGELPYSLGVHERTHFQCFQYNAFQALDLIAYMDLSGDETPRQLTAEIVSFLHAGIDAGGRVPYACDQRDPEVPYHLAAVAAALKESARLGLADTGAASNRAYERLLGLQGEDGSFPHSMRDYGLLSTPPLVPSQPGHDPPPSPPGSRLMCGICGVYDLAQTGTVDQHAVRDMLSSIAHRGPDDEGLFADDLVALGARRLSIIDLPGGSQPLRNEDGSVIVVFNGEIYNYRELQERLRHNGHRLRSDGDGAGRQRRAGQPRPVSPRRHRRVVGEERDDDLDAERRHDARVPRGRLGAGGAAARHRRRRTRRRHARAAGLRLQARPVVRGAAAQHRELRRLHEPRDELAAVVQRHPRPVAVRPEPSRRDGRERLGEGPRRRLLLLGRHRLQPPRMDQRLVVRQPRHQRARLPVRRPRLDGQLRARRPPVRAGERIELVAQRRRRQHRLAQGADLGDERSRRDLSAAGRHQGPDAGRHAAGRRVELEGPDGRLRPLRHHRLVALLRQRGLVQGARGSAARAVDGCWGYHPNLIRVAAFRRSG